MNENCNCFKFHDVTQTWILNGAVFTFAKVITKQLIFHT